MTRSASLLLILLLAACTAGGHSDSGSIPEQDPFITGTITSVQPDHILIEEDPAEQSGSAKAMLEISEKTRLLKRDGAVASRSDLRVRGRVSAWADGPVRESYPVQTTARVIVIEP